MYVCMYVCMCVCVYVCVCVCMYVCVRMYVYVCGPTNKHIHINSYGYRCSDSRNNLVYNKAGQIIYPVAGVVVALDAQKNVQSYNRAHTDDVLWFVVCVYM